jgi:hypothetical protein
MGFRVLVLRFKVALIWQDRLLRRSDKLSSVPVAPFPESLALA